MNALFLYGKINDKDNFDVMEGEEIEGSVGKDLNLQVIATRPADVDPARQEPANGETSVCRNENDPCRCGRPEPDRLRVDGRIEENAPPGSHETQVCQTGEQHTSGLEEGDGNDRVLGVVRFDEDKGCEYGAGKDDGRGHDLGRG